MLPARIEDATTPLKPPADWNEAENGHCAELPIKADMVNGVRFMFSAWEVEPHEALTILAGGKIRLGVSGLKHPVVNLAAMPPMDQMGPVSTVREIVDNLGRPCVEVETLWPPLEGSTTPHRGRCAALVNDGGVPMAVGLAFSELAKLARQNRWVE